MAPEPPILCVCREGGHSTHHNMTPWPPHAARSQPVDTTKTRQSLSWMDGWMDGARVGGAGIMVAVTQCSTGWNCPPTHITCTLSAIGTQTLLIVHGWGRGPERRPFLHRRECLCLATGLQGGLSSTDQCHTTTISNRLLDLSQITIPRRNKAIHKKIPTLCCHVIGDPKPMKLSKVLALCVHGGGTS